MAEKEKKPEKGAAEPAAEAAPAAEKKKLPVKTIALVGAALVIEAVVICAAFMLSGKPAEVKADHAAVDVAAEADVPLEMMVIADKFQNTRSGRTYLYDTEIYMVVKKKNEDRVEERMKANAAQVSAEIATIFRRAEPAHLLEPTLGTLTRQIKAVLDEKIGKDAEGASMVESVLIKKYAQFRSE